MSIKVKLRRTKTGEVFNFTHLDGTFIRGSVERLPVIGQPVVFYHRRFGDGWWTTTPVQTITKRGRTIEFETRNSKYVLVKGWGEE